MMGKESNMKISVSNYGPIDEAKDIELCPLTVFVGPSNTGKSYLAILIYSLFRSFEEGRFIPLLRRGRRGKNVSLFDTESMHKDIDNFARDLQKCDMSEDFPFSDLPDEFQKWISRNVAENISRNFHEEISRCMGFSTEDRYLINNEFKLDFSNNQASFVFGLNQPPSIQRREFNLTEKSFERLCRFAKSFVFAPDSKGVNREIRIETFIRTIPKVLFNPHSERGSFYLPAARTGIMQSHRAIAGALVEQAALADPEQFSVPTLSGIVSDFLSGIIRIDTTKIPNRHEVKKVADEMEKNILHGYIKSESLESNSYPQFTYKQNGIEVPLLRSSSMVSELAPVVLFLRHRVGKGDLLIIEEPEAHLHPEAQRNIARTIVRLVRAGVRVVVTTHSDYFLEQLENHVRLSKLSEDEQKEFSGTKDLSLSEDDVGVYGFKFNEGKKGTTVKRLHISAEDGLSPDDHAQVSSDLYNQTVAIIDRIESKIDKIESKIDKIERKD